MPTSSPAAAPVRRRPRAAAARRDRAAAPPVAARLGAAPAAHRLRVHRRWCCRSSAPDWCSSRASSPRRTRRWRPRPAAPSPSSCRPTRGEILDRNGEPLADSVDGRMVVADPVHDPEQGAATWRRFLARRLHVDYFTTLQRADRRRTAGSPTSPAACPASLALDVVDAGDRRRLQGPRHPRRPAADLPRPRRRGQPGRLHGHRRTAGRPRAAPSTSSSRARTARRPTRSVPATGSRSGTARSSPAHNGTDLHTTIDEDLQWYTQRVLRQTVLGARGDSGFAVVMDSHTGEILVARRLPDVRREQPAGLARQGPQLAGDDQPLRAGLGGEGAHPQLR